MIVIVWPGQIAAQLRRSAAAVLGHDQRHGGWRFRQKQQGVQGNFLRDRYGQPVKPVICGFTQKVLPGGGGRLGQQPVQPEHPDKKTAAVFLGHRFRQAAAPFRRLTGLPVEIGPDAVEIAGPAPVGFFPEIRREEKRFHPVSPPRGTPAGWHPDRHTPCRYPVPDTPLRSIRSRSGR